MKKLRNLCLILIVACMILPMTVVFADEETSEPVFEESDVPAGDVSVVSGCRTLDARVPLFTGLEEEETMRAAILYEVSSETMVYNYNPDLKLSPASLVKIMTALLAIERGDLHKKVTVTAEALSTISSATMTVGLLEGEILTLEELLYCLMIGSGNDAANVIAIEISGSEAAFVEDMNKKAEELGCTGTHFVNAHGVEDDNQYSTARDIGKIVLEAMKYETFQTLFSTENYVVPQTNLCSEERVLRTSNYLISKLTIEVCYDSRVVGGRAGLTDDELRCVAAYSERNGMQYITVVLGGETVYKSGTNTIQSYGGFHETSSLLTLGYDNYEIMQVLYEGQILNQYPVLGGTNNIVIGPNSNVSVVLPLDLEESDLSWRYQENITSLTPPVEQGKHINVLQVWYGNVCIAQTELVTMNSARDAGNNFSTQSQSEDTGGSALTRILTVLGVLAGVVITFAAVLYIIRWVRTVKIRARSRRRRQSRRRSR